MKTIRIIRGHDGTLRYVYDDDVHKHLSKLGEVSIKRATHVEPDENGLWYADLSPVGGEKVTGFKTHQEAIDFELKWLNEHNIPLPEGI